MFLLIKSFHLLKIMKLTVFHLFYKNNKKNLLYYFLYICKYYNELYSNMNQYFYLHNNLYIMNYYLNFNYLDNQ